MVIACCYLLLGVLCVGAVGWQQPGLLHDPQQELYDELVKASPTLRLHYPIGQFPNHSRTRHLSIGWQCNLHSRSESISSANERLKLIFGERARYCIEDNFNCELNEEILTLKERLFWRSTTRKRFLLWSPLLVPLDSKYCSIPSFLSIYQSIFCLSSAPHFWAFLISFSSLPLALFLSFFPALSLCRPVQLILKEL